MGIAARRDAEQSPGDETLPVDRRLQGPLQRVEGVDRPIDREGETERVELAGAQEQERVHLCRDRFRGGIVATQGLGRVREPAIARADGRAGGRARPAPP